MVKSLSSWEIVWVWKRQSIERQRKDLSWQGPSQINWHPARSVHHWLGSISIIGGLTCWRMCWLHTIPQIGLPTRAHCLSSSLHYKEFYHARFLWRRGKTKDVCLSPLKTSPVTQITLSYLAWSDIAKSSSAGPDRQPRTCQNYVSTVENDGPDVVDCLYWQFSSHQRMVIFLWFKGMVMVMKMMYVLSYDL